MSVDIDPRKLDYLLQRNAGKAKFFSSCGFDPSRPQELDSALRQHVVLNPYASWEKTAHGIKTPARDLGCLKPCEQVA